MSVTPWLQGYQDSQRPTEDYADEGNELYSNGQGCEAYELHRREDAHLSAWQDEYDPKLRELMQAKKLAPSTPTPPNGSRKAFSPDSVLFPPGSFPLPGLRGAASKTKKTRRPSSGPQKTHDYSLHTAGVSLPLADPLPLPNGTPVSKNNPLEGIARTH